MSIKALGDAFEQEKAKNKALLIHQSEMEKNVEDDDGLIEEERKEIEDEKECVLHMDSD